VREDWPPRGYRSTVRKNLTGVVEQYDPVAEKTPALLVVAV
jgi:hypothetical protein